MSEGTPLDAPESGPVLTAPGGAPGDGVERLKGDTSNETHEGLLTYGSKRLSTAYINIDDVIPPHEKKRYSRYLTVNKSPSEYHGITLIFRGTHPGMLEAEDAVESPPLSDGIKMLHDMGEGKSAMTIDTIYQIEVLSLQSARSCPIPAGKTQKFSFNNGARHEVKFSFTTEKNIHVAFDVINNASLACVIRFDVIVSMEVN